MAARRPRPVSCVNYDARFAFLGFYTVPADLSGSSLGVRISNAAIAHAGALFETARMYTGAIATLRLDRVFGVTTLELG